MVTICSRTTKPLAKVTVRVSPSSTVSVTKPWASRVWIAPASLIASQANWGGTLTWNSLQIEAMDPPRRAKSEIQAQPLLHLLVQVAGEIGGRAVGRDLAQAEHADAIRHAHDPPHVVVNQQDAHVRPGELLDPDEHFFRDARRQPDAGLVDQAQPGLRQP